MADKVLMAKQMRKAIQAYVQDTVKDESKMMEFADIYPEWEEILNSKMEYPAGTVFKYGTNDDGETQLWSFISNYTPQAQYKPDVDISHYKKIGFAEGTSYQIWSQPYGATDCYMKDDIVSYEGTLYKSLVDYNVWSPTCGTSGLWEKYTEETPEEPDTGDKEDPEEPTKPEYPEFVQPTGAHDAYNTGDIVSYEGRLYICNVDACVYAPNTQGAESMWSEYTPEPAE